MIRVGERVHVALKDHVEGDWLPPACKFADVIRVQADGRLDLKVDNGALPSRMLHQAEFSDTWQHQTFHLMDGCPLDGPQSGALPAPPAPVISNLASEIPLDRPHLVLLQGGLTEEAA